MIQKKDQNGTAHEYTYDELGRVLHDRITSVGTGVDNGVLRISTTHGPRGEVEKLTSYDNATVGSGNVVNEVVFEHDEMDLLVKEFQEHAGAKDGSTPSVEYTYDDTSAAGAFTKGLRPKSVKYPNARLVHFGYDTTTADATNRIDAIKADNGGSPGDSFAEYDYLGESATVRVDYPDLDIRYDLAHGDGSDPYDGLDRFDRVSDMLWRNYGGTPTDEVRIKHGYDRVANRLYREDPVAADETDLDEYYTYDGMYQLTNLDRGDLNVGKTAISGTPVWEEDFTLDATGNWTDFVQKVSGTTDLDQSRTHNKANEITDIINSQGSSSGSSCTPGDQIAHDRAGNMTKTPKADDWCASYDLTHDRQRHLDGSLGGRPTAAQADPGDCRRLCGYPGHGSSDRLRPELPIDLRLSRPVW